MSVLDDAVSLGPATREAGLAHLRRFAPRAGRDYAEQRNTDRGPSRHVSVSTLSPWIRHRLISEREVVAAVLEQHTEAAAEKFIQEVFWRTYWKGWLEMRPTVWSGYRTDVQRLQDSLARDGDLQSRFDAAVSGRTGIACFDAWTGELIETGYLHNHARMWFASIWIFTLDLPWQLGAEFFLRHLLDGDPASNTLSWRWVAGIQTLGKTYLARPDNIARFTEGRFAPKPQQLATSAVPLDGPPPPSPIPAPISDQAQWDGSVGLLVTEDDLNPEWILRNGSPAGVAVLAPSTEWTTGTWSPAVVAFKTAAVSDVVQRLQAATGRPVDRVGGGGAAFAGIADWARSRGLRHIVTSYPPVGIARDRVDQQAAELEAMDVSMARVIRDWDRQAWPHATKGFFPFKAHIPDFLMALPAMSS